MSRKKSKTTSKKARKQENPAAEISVPPVRAVRADRQNTNRTTKSLVRVGTSPDTMAKIALLNESIDNADERGLTEDVKEILSSFRINYESLQESLFAAGVGKRIADTKIKTSCYWVIRKPSWFKKFVSFFSKAGKEEEKPLPKKISYQEFRTSERERKILEKLLDKYDFECETAKKDPSILTIEVTPE